jgi:hypothetical protein
MGYKIQSGFAKGAMLTPQAFAIFAAAAVSEKFKSAGGE